MILSILIRLGKKKKQQIVILVQLTNTGGKTRTKQAFLDSGVEKNYIKQSFITNYK
jgi:hypothetical protein